MKHDICSIPISEVFEPKDGCPICRLRDMLEKKMVEYITGAAMMEPDVRIETNKKGFCLNHYNRMLGLHKHLSVALTMQSRLEELDRQVFGTGLLAKDPAKQGRSATAALSTCFVCDEVNTNLYRMLENTCHLWSREREFRQLFEQQPDLCLPHFALLAEAAGKSLPKKERTEFIKVASGISRRSLDALRADIDHFTRMYDYRSGKGENDWGTAKDSPERVVRYLSSRAPEKA
ncbi:MAG: hypothetical protein IJE00_05905 [Clostridia bacterium]|nr:hypothetical protein [Clostridia bacterium]